MGRAHIISDDGDGLYTAQIQVDTIAAEAEHARVTASLSEIATRLTTETDPAAIAYLNGRKIALQKRLDTLAAIKDNPAACTVWCADYSEGLSGDVGTLEIAAERRMGVNIQPGYEGGSAYDADRDGSTVPVLSLPMMTAIYNYALMPGVQKWRPTYRYGVISNLDKSASTCDVAFVAARSVVDNLNVNQTNLTAVPIQYMSCDGAAFEDGDTVAVRFTDNDWQSPVVVGFRDHPRPCFARYLQIKNGAAVLIYDIVGRRFPDVADLPAGAPYGPVARDTTIDAWLAAHVTIAAEQVEFAGIDTTIDYNQILPGDYPQGEAAETYHIDLPCYITFPPGFDTGTLTCDDYQTFEDVFETLTASPIYVIPEMVRSHTGGSIDSAYGITWASVSVQLDKIVHPDNPAFYYYTWTRTIESFLGIVEKNGVSKALTNGGGYPDRSFIVTAESTGIRIDHLSEGYYPETVSHEVYSTLKFYSPFEVAPIHTLDLMVDPLETVGESVVSPSLVAGSKHDDDDMVGYCIFSYQIRDHVADTSATPSTMPYVALYSKIGIDPAAPPNPFTACYHDAILSSAVEDLIVNLSGGSLAGLSIDFINIAA